MLKLARRFLLAILIIAAHRYRHHPQPGVGWLVRCPHVRGFDDDSVLTASLTLPPAVGKTGNCRSEDRAAFLRGPRSTAKPVASTTAAGRESLQDNDYEEREPM